METTSAFLCIPDRIQAYKAKADHGCLRSTAREPSELVSRTLSNHVGVIVGSDTDAALVKDNLDSLVSMLDHMRVQDKGPLLASLSDEDW
jgi:hypothetical protein